MNKIKIVMAVMAVVMVFGTTAVAFAQGPQPPQTPTPPKSEYGQTFWQILAQKLGVTVDKLQQAVRDALKETVGKMLSDGKLTQAQADKAQAGMDKLPLDSLPFGQFFRGRQMAEARVRFSVEKIALDAAATKLGLTSQDLLNQLRQGKTLADLAKEKNVTLDDLKAAMVKAVDDQMAQAVKDGKLTQAQADQIKTQVDKINLDNAFGKGGFNGHRNFGRGGKMPWQRPPLPAKP